MPGQIALTWSALPGVPSGVTASGGNSQVTATWTAPSDPGTGTSRLHGERHAGGRGQPVAQTFNTTATTETLGGLVDGAHTM